MYQVAIKLRDWFNANTNRTIEYIGPQAAPVFAVSSNEYRVAMRILEKADENDFHFFVQTNTGEWAHRFLYDPPQKLGFLNPTTVNWRLYTPHNYNSETVYFAVRK